MAKRSENDGLAPNTIRKRISNAKQFFQDAVAREVLTKNPFIELNGSVGANHERDYFITREVADQVLEACPDDQWRLLFALSRFGGLRCPSEHLALRWTDIDWATCRMRVTSPKTEHYEGGGYRVVPLFPELRGELDRVFTKRDNDQPFVIFRYRQTNANLRTQFQRILKQAGIQPWPKLFQNLRASRATELADEYPEHVAAAWIGHSPDIAKRHYWRVTEEHFTNAVHTSEDTSNSRLNMVSNPTSPQSRHPNGCSPRSRTTQNIL